MLDPVLQAELVKTKKIRGGSRQPGNAAEFDGAIRLDGRGSFAGGFFWFAATGLWLRRRFVLPVDGRFAPTRRWRPAGG